MKFIVPQRLLPGDKVAIISPSSGLPYLFPWVYELGLKRIREVLKLEPVEFSTALKSSEYLEKNPKARADDINKAFSDESIKGIITTIGGNDQIRILPYLDKHIMEQNPKIFLGYSDSTNLHLFLWNLGIVSYYGGAVMTQFAMQGEMHDFTIKYLKKALFDNSIGCIESSPYRTDCDLDWTDESNLSKKRPMEKSEEWLWYNNKNKIVHGRLWGGCLEILYLHLSVKTYLPKPEELENTILYVETSEEMPSEGFVYRFFAALGELGWLNKIQAVLMAYPKSQFCGMLPPSGKENYIISQKIAVKKALQDYNSDLLVVFNLNFGHTDPQLIIPNGGMVTLNGSKHTIAFN